MHFPVDVRLRDGHTYPPSCVNATSIPIDHLLGVPERYVNFSTALYKKNNKKENYDLNLVYKIKRIYLITQKLKRIQY